MNTKIKAVAAIACGVVACGLSQSAHANLITNPGFDGNTGQLNYDTTITGWTAAGSAANNYDFIFPGPIADLVGAFGSQGNVSLWGPHTPHSSTTIRWLMDSVFHRMAATSSALIPTIPRMLETRLS